MIPLNQVTLSLQELNLGRVTTNHNICLEEPKRLGYFSSYYDNENKSVYCPDKSALRYLDLPDPVNINCLQGYDSNIKYGHRRPKSSNLLRWILENETILSNFTYDFICSNGLLKDLMVSPYYDYEWNLCAVKIRGKIVLSTIESIGKKENIDVQTEKDNKSTYVGLNLKSLVTKNNNQCTSARDEASFFGVFNTKIGSHRILHSGYLDCVESEQETSKSFDDMKFVLVKKYNAPRVSHTSLHANTWWSLAKLAGVDTVMRTKCEQDFTVENIDKLQVERLIHKHRQMIFVTSLDLILNHLKSVVTEENKCYNFHFNGKDKRLTGYMTMDLDDNLIPSWYINEQLPLES
ncbi:decapping and exoribonuclease protein-like [Tetranychus urticae]|uniref:Decapping nuclease n=1 Tax=Tetranychus urticae TaxID=32264 RepID=T1KUD0_TETUR|nr:decapping and exoribonuclease protein-like [Tetranychus urticae]